MRYEQEGADLLNTLQSQQEKLDFLADDETVDNKLRQYGRKMMDLEVYVEKLREKIREEITDGALTKGKSFIMPPNTVLYDETAPIAGSGQAKIKKLKKKKKSRQKVRESFKDGVVDSPREGDNPNPISENKALPESEVIPDFKNTSIKVNGFANSSNYSLLMTEKEELMSIPTSTEKLNASANDKLSLITDGGSNNNSYYNIPTVSVISAITEENSRYEQSSSQNNENSPEVFMRKTLSEEIADYADSDGGLEEGDQQLLLPIEAVQDLSSSSRRRIWSNKSSVKYSNKLIDSEKAHSSGDHTVSVQENTHLLENQVQSTALVTFPSHLDVQEVAPSVAKIQSLCRGYLARKVVSLLMASRVVRVFSHEFGRGEFAS